MDSKLIKYCQLNMMQYPSMYGTALNSIALHCSTLHYTVLFFDQVYPSVIKNRWCIWDEIYNILSSTLIGNKAIYIQQTERKVRIVVYSWEESVSI